MSGFDPAALAAIVGQHDEELRVLRAQHDLLKEMVDALGEASEALRQATSDMLRIIERHDQTLRAMHRGLHRTSDPEAPQTW